MSVRYLAFASLTEDLYLIRSSLCISYETYNLSFSMHFLAVPANRAYGFVQPRVFLVSCWAMELNIDKQDLWKRCINSPMFKQAEEDFKMGL